MIPINLQISGFLSYAQTAELDFTRFDIAGISGPNGAGKSSLLDAITWALFGIARKRDESIINSQKKTAEVSFDFEYEGHLYRINRTRTRGKPARLDFFIRHPEGWSALTEPTLSATEQSIRNVLHMDYETFTNASFFLQGKADQFAQQPPADRKRILGNILGLEVWETYREQTAEMRKQVEISLSIEESRLADIVEELNQEEHRKILFQEAQTKLQQATTLKEAKQSILNSARSQFSLLEEQAKTLQVLKEQWDQDQAEQEQMQEQLTRLDTEIRSYDAWIQNRNTIEAGFLTWQQTHQELQALNDLAMNFQQFQQKRTPLVVEIEKEQSRLMELKLQLEKSENEASFLETAIFALQSDIEEVTREIETLEQAQSLRAQTEEEITRLTEQIASLSAMNTHINAEGKTINTHIEQLQISSSPQCPMCGQALTPAKKEQSLLDLNQQVADLRDQYRSNHLEITQSTESLKSLRAQIQQFEDAARRIKEFSQKRSGKTEKLHMLQEQWNTWLNQKQPQLTHVRQQLENQDFARVARQELQHIDEQLKQTGYDTQRHQTQRQKEQELLPFQSQYQKLAQAQAALVPSQRQYDEIQTRLIFKKSKAETSLAAYQEMQQTYQTARADIPDLNQAEREFINAQELENIERRNLHYAEQAVSLLETQKQRKAELEQTTRLLREQIARLRQVEKACSKDGVPALLIEQALPELENQTNAILERLSGGSMNVRFITQTGYKDKKRDDKKETLEIVIQDASGARSYELFSGGEAFRVNFSIRLALSHLLANRSGARLQTLIIDEGFGSQDTQGRQRLIEAINMVRPDFKKILVITHLEELKDAFSTRIEVEKNNQTSVITVQI